MNIREALINQQPSLAGWREAQAEIARLDAKIEQLESKVDELEYSAMEAMELALEKDV